MSIQYLATSNASTSKNYVQMPQFQVMTVANPTSSPTVETKSTSKRSSKANKNNAESQVEPAEEQQHIQLVTMDQNSINGDCNNQYIIQIPQNQMGGQFQMISNGNMAPMQFLNLAEGATFVPISQTASYSAQPTQPTILQTSDGQQIQFVISSDGIYNHDSSAPITTMAFSSAPTEEAKPSDDAPCYVNPKQYARIYQRRGARAALEMQGRISKQRRTYLHESRHKHALNRVRGDGGKFNSNLNDTFENSSLTSSPTSSIGKTTNNSFESLKNVKNESMEPPQKRFAPQPN